MSIEVYLHFVIWTNHYSNFFFSLEPDSEFSEWNVLVHSNGIILLILIRAVAMFWFIKRIGSYESLVLHFDYLRVLYVWLTKKNNRLIRMIRSTTLVVLYVSNARLSTVQELNIIKIKITLLLYSFCKN